MRRVASTLVAVAGLALGAAAQDPAREAAAAVLAELGGRQPRTLDGVVLEWVETRLDRRGSATEGARVLAALAHPDRLRLEVRRPQSSPIVIKVFGDRVWVGPPGGPFTLAPPETRELAERTLRLLGTLVGWDLRGADDVSLDGATLRSRARWLDRDPAPERNALVVERVLEGRRVRSIRIGAAAYELDGEFQGSGGKLPHVRPATDRPGMRFSRYDPGAAFKDGYFLPTAELPPDRELAQAGEEARNFDQPVLGRIPAAHVLARKDPGGFAERLAELDRLGRALHELGQMPAGLPVYTSDGRMQVLFRPRNGQEARVPDGMSFVVRRPGFALVLYAEGRWGDVAKNLEKRLRSHAKKIGLELVGPLRLIPYVLPGQGEPPGEDTPVLVRAEWPVR